MMTTREAIAEGYKAFERAYYEGDAVAISSMYTEDAALLVPEAPIITGRDAINQAWKLILGSGGNTVRVEIGEVTEIGDWAYEVGGFTASAPDGTFLYSGKYIVIWKRQTSGTWMIHRDIFNWDIPPSQPST
jgi:ketosteroid isomerase-like protein